MRHLSWNLRLVIGLVVFIIIAAVIFVIYYNVARTQLDKPMEVEKYPGSALIFEEAVYDGTDRLYYEFTGDAAAVNENAQRVEKFYADKDYTCRALYDNAEYVYSTCLLEKSHFLGFDRFNRIRIVPLRDEAEAVTGKIGIEVTRNWGSNGGIGN